MSLLSRYSCFPFSSHNSTLFTRRWVCNMSGHSLVYAMEICCLFSAILEFIHLCFRRFDSWWVYCFLNFDHRHFLEQIMFFIRELWSILFVTHEHNKIWMRLRWCEWYFRKQQPTNWYKTAFTPKKWIQNRLAWKNARHASSITTKLNSNGIDWKYALIPFSYTHTRSHSHSKRYGKVLSDWI